MKFVISSLCMIVFSMCCLAQDIADGFPGDFPKILDNGGNGKGQFLHGFGGNSAFDQAANRAAVKRNPIILLHGNGGNAQHFQWGMLTMRQFLLEWGYNESEIWAVSYLGKDNGSADMPTPHANNIEDVRNFIDTVREYLDVQKVDIVSHSLGGTLAKCYLLGYEKNGSYNASLQRFDAVGTVITLAAANYGLGLFSIGDFKTGSSFEQKLHFLGSVQDDTPFGSNSTDEQIGQYKGTSSLDNGQITYVAVWAEGDFVDQQNRHTGRLQGAHLNRGYNLGSGLGGHERILKDKVVFSDIVNYLNTNPNNPPQPLPPVVSITPNGGEFIGRITVNIRATNKPEQVQYCINDGEWQPYTQPFVLNDSAVVKAKAQNVHGKSEIITAEFTKSPTPPYESVLATANEHYIAKRLDTNEYLAMGQKYGYLAPFYLYSLEGSDDWTDEKPE